MLGGSTTTNLGDEGMWKWYKSVDEDIKGKCRKIYRLIVYVVCLLVLLVNNLMAITGMNNSS